MLILRHFPSSSEKATPKNGIKYIGATFSAVIKNRMTELSRACGCDDPSDHFLLVLSTIILQVQCPPGGLHKCLMLKHCVLFHVMKSTQYYSLEYFTHFKTK